MGDLCLLQGLTIGGEGCQNMPPQNILLFFLKAEDKMCVKGVLPMPRKKKYFYHQRLGVKAERIPYKQTLLSKSYLPLASPYILVTFHNCLSLLNLVK